MRSERAAASFLLGALAAGCGSTDLPTSAPSPPAAPVQRVLALSRDAIETFTVGADGRLARGRTLEGFAPAFDAVATASGDRLYVATLNGVEGFRVDAEAGSLARLSPTRNQSGTAPAFLAMGTAGAFVYGWRSRELVAYAADASGGLSAFHATATTGVGLAVEPSGRFAYGVSAAGIAAHRIPPDGSLVPLAGSPFPLLPSGGNPTALFAGRAGPHLYFVAQTDGLRPANLQLYRFDPASGSPEPVAQYQTPGDATPTAIAGSASGATLYVAYRERSGADPAPCFVQSYAVDRATGRLAAAARVDVGPGIFSKLSLAQDGATLFVTLEPAQVTPPQPPTQVVAIALGAAEEPLGLRGSLETTVGVLRRLFTIASPGR